MYKAAAKSLLLLLQPSSPCLSEGRALGAVKSRNLTMTDSSRKHLAMHLA